MKEATARIKINKLLQMADWRFFADASGSADGRLEPGAALTTQVLDDLGEDSEKVTKGFVDFLLLNDKGFPLILLEAKAEDKNALAGKYQSDFAVQVTSQVEGAQQMAINFTNKKLLQAKLHEFFELESSSRELIIRFAQQIQATLARVWGDGNGAS